MNKNIVFLILAFLLWHSGNTQNQSTAGGFLYKFYNVKSYNTHPRNFSITQDEREIMYFGNAYGVLEYDGTTWRNTSLPNGNSAVSLSAPTTDGKIYLTSYGDFGFLASDPIGRTIYTSLSPLIEKSTIRADAIINIFNFQNKIYLNTRDGIYHINKNSVQPFLVDQPSKFFPFVKEVNGHLLVQSAEDGLRVFEENALHAIEGGELLKNALVKDLIFSCESKIMILEEKGLFKLVANELTPLNEKTNKIISVYQLRKLVKLHNGNLLVTTNGNGFYILDSNGNIISHMSRNNGFPSNAINDVFIDKRGGVWFALDNGIVHMELNSTLTYLGAEDGVQGMGYAAALFENKLYLGTSEGLFYCEWNNSLSHNNFTLVEGIKGQIWSLDVIDNTLLCSQTDHLFNIKGNRAKIISSAYDNEGNWKVAPLHGYSGFAIKGTYSGFQLYKKENNEWKFLRKLQGFNESCRVFVQDKEGSIWMCHGNKGIYKMVLSKDLSKIASVENYSEKNHLSADFFNDVSFMDGRLIFSADDGPYILNGNDTFLKYITLENAIGKHRYINRLTQCGDGTAWIFSGDEILFLSTQISKESLVKQNSILKRIKGSYIGSFEFVMPVSNGKVIIGSQEGFIIFDWKENLTPHIPYTTAIRSVVASLHNDSLLYAGNSIHKNTSALDLSLPYSVNSIRISYAATWYMNGDNILYQYALSKNSDSTIHWSGWTKSTRVDFTNLREGNYWFRVRAINDYGDISKEGIYKFSISPPWFRSIWAYSIYSLVMIGLLIIFYKLLKAKFIRQRIQLEEQKRKELMVLQQKHLTERLLTEKELMALRNDKLESDMILKNNELASLAASLTQKTELLTYLKDKLMEVSDPLIDGQGDFKEVIKTIDQDLDFDDHWSKFQKHFDEIHFNFLHRLREKYPKLNPSWLLLCAYIRMNKSNKEIASLLNISVAGVEKRKYRLREKLEIESDNKLSDFISGF